MEDIKIQEKLELGFEGYRNFKNLRVRFQQRSRTKEMKEQTKY